MHFRAVCSVITIVEGADGTGKTTLARRIAETSGAKYLHAGAPTRATWWEEYVAPCVDQQANLVLDRWHVGERVWPELFNRRSLFRSDDDYQSCCYELAKAGARLILVIRRDDAIIAELSRRGEEDQLSTVLQSQRLFLSTYTDTSSLPKTVVDSDTAWRFPCMF